MKLRSIVAATARLVLAVIPIIVRDAAGLAGAALIVYGILLVYQPAAYIIGGGMLLSAAWLYARRS